MERAPGELVAAILKGAWRRKPSPPDLSLEELSQVVPLLNGSGAASLGWWRIWQAEEVRHRAELAELHAIYRLVALEELINLRAIEHVAVLLRQIPVTPLIFKGWAVAQHYAATHLRPYGDLDIWVPPQHYAAATEILRTSSPSGMLVEPGRFELDYGPLAKTLTVDLHEDLKRYRLAQPAAMALYQRSLQKTLGGAAVRVPAPEDHLRLVAIHFLGHGGWRPLWLCDIAAIMEDLPPSFDWDLCLGRDPRIERWISCVVLLAHRLLGARIDRLPEKYQHGDLPRWLVTTVLREWDAPFAARHTRPLVAQWLRRPRMIPGEVKARWPNAVKATVALNGSFGDSPRLPFQIAHFGSTVVRFALRLISGRLQKAAAS